MDIEEENRIPLYLKDTVRQSSLYRQEDWITQVTATTYKVRIREKEQLRFISFLDWGSVREGRKGSKRVGEEEEGARHACRVRTRPPSHHVSISSFTTQKKNSISGFFPRWHGPLLINIPTSHFFSAAKMGRKGPYVVLPDTPTLCFLLMN